jgi:hypothetical protein
MRIFQDLAQFRSARFAPVLPEDCQVNPGVYGAELAFWLCACLYQEHRVATSYPEYEDWGWVLSYTTKAGDDFTVHCGNISGSGDHWLISIRRYGRKWFGRDKPSFQVASDLADAVRCVLEGDESVTELEWLYGIDTA